MMKLCLNHRPPLGQLLDVSSPSVNLRCFRSALKQLPPPGSDPAPPRRSRKLAQRSCSDDCASAGKKRVAFADSKGLSLTAVCFFTDKDECPSPEPVLRLEALGVPVEGTCAGKSPRLGFPLPSADFQTFRARLQEGLVLLESCSVTERALSGTVRVKNVSYQKDVRLRVTFDSWRSHHNVPCTYMHQSYGAPDTDAFAFDVPLPRDLDPRERIEFCISYQPGGYSTPLWDNNMGQNYSILTEPEATARSHRPPFAVASHNRDLWVPQLWGRQHGPESRALHRSASCSEILLNQSSGTLENCAPFW
ncbi:protein phosphatase 1 regulatory subunit 3C-B-like [Scleropages formosus]|nr:protein phosphatase 1 regulatory subunit 3C-like isoform X2 [Scleropages formosus]KPP60689.1 protein phosphatase 1 regulatory subunit 3C-B-like [Scleropages formosus]